MNKHLREIYEVGYEVFGDKEKFHKWLELKYDALGGRVPASFLTTPEGIALVKKTLIKIQSGNLK